MTTSTADLDTTSRLALLDAQDADICFADFTHYDAITVGQRVIALARQ